MKKTGDIIGLPVVSIFDGSEVGKILGVIIDADERQISYFVVDYGRELIGAKVIASDNVTGIGEYALTIENLNSVVWLTKSPDALDALEKGITIINTKAVTKKGRNVGDIVEIFVDENQKCRIVGTEFIASSDEDGLSVGVAKLLPDRCVITYGKLLTVIEDQFVSELVDIPYGDGSAVSAPMSDAAGLPPVRDIGFAASVTSEPVTSKTSVSVETAAQSETEESVLQTLDLSYINAESYADPGTFAEPAAVETLTESAAYESADAADADKSAPAMPVPAESVAAAETAAEIVEPSAADVAGVSEVSEPPEKPESSEASEAEAEAEEGMFEDRQRKYLLGRKVSKKIVGSGGAVIATEGTVITDEIITKSKEHGKMVQLVMNNRA